MADDDRLSIDAALVRRLVAGQFPQWAALPIGPVTRDGWDNSTFRLGDTMKVRLPTSARYVPQVEKEQLWLPRLAPLLLLPIPAPLGLGRPAEGYPYPWSVYGWLHGETAAAERIGGGKAFARDVAQFLLRLQAIAPDGPAAGEQNFFRGGPLAVYDAETRRAIATLGDAIDGAGATAAWDAALAARWTGTPVWVHGDVAVGNLLVRDGRLAAVIDFGSSGVGDPACDLVLAWTFLEGTGRAAFRDAMAADAAIWARARGWALWKALITLAASAATNPAENSPTRIIGDVIAEHFSAAAAASLSGSSQEL